MAKVRADITLDDDLLKWAREHARMKRTNLSAYINALLAKEKELANELRQFLPLPAEWPRKS